MKKAQENNRPSSIDVPVTNTTDRKRRLLTLLAMLLLGPTPGAVGSCNQEADNSRVLNAGDEMIDYCQQKEQLICYRRHLRDEIDADEFTECRHEAIRLCETRYWSPECRPTERRAQACLRALSSKDTLDTKESEIKECLPDEVCKDVEIVGSEPSEPDAGDES